MKVYKIIDKDKTSAKIWYENAYEGCILRIEGKTEIVEAIIQKLTQKDLEPLKNCEGL